MEFFLGKIICSDALNFFMKEILPICIILAIRFAVGTVSIVLIKM